MSRPAPPVGTPYEGQLPSTPRRQVESWRIYDRLSRERSPLAGAARLAYHDVMRSVTAEKEPGRARGVGG